MKGRVTLLVSDSAEHNLKQGFFLCLYTQHRKQELFTKYQKRVVTKVFAQLGLIKETQKSLFPVRSASCLHFALPI